MLKLFRSADPQGYCWICSTPRNSSESRSNEARSRATTDSLLDSHVGDRWNPSSQRLLTPVADGAKSAAVLTLPKPPVAVLHLRSRYHAQVFQTMYSLKLLSQYLCVRSCCLLDAVLGLIVGFVNVGWPPCYLIQFNYCAHLGLRRGQDMSQTFSPPRTR